AQRGAQVVELGVDRDPQRLERARRRVDAAARDDPADQAGELAGRRDRRALAGRHDRAGDLARARLLAEPADQVGQLALRQVADLVLGRARRQQLDRLAEQDREVDGRRRLVDQRRPTGTLHLLVNPRDSRIGPITASLEYGASAGGLTGARLDIPSDQT